MAMDRSPASSPNNLGLVYAEMRERVRAAEAFHEAIKRDSTLSVAYGNLAEANLMLGRTDDARAMLDLYASKFPDAPGPRQPPTLSVASAARF
ncbi:MAG: tetratricopeptide repeat protein [Longimicrobiales bacterium]